MPKIVLEETNSGYNLQKINNNFKKIEDEFNKKVMYRDNPVLEPNEMITDVDMNSKRIYNLPAPVLDHEAARLKDVQEAIVGNVQVKLAADQIIYLEQTGTVGIRYNSSNGRIEFIHQGVARGHVDLSLTDHAF